MLLEEQESVGVTRPELDSTHYLWNDTRLLEARLEKIQWPLFIRC
jgi:hypothetical protein